MKLSFLNMTYLNIQSKYQNTLCLFVFFGLDDEFLSELSYNNKHNIRNMGDSLSSCCTPPQNLQFAREIITQEGVDGFDSLLKDFFVKFPRMKELYSRKWSYCPKINRTKIVIRPQGTFVGYIDPADAHEAIAFYNEGFLYEGQILNWKREGLGRLISQQGDCYQGKWHDNEPNGEGIYEGSSPKRKYTGVWQAGSLQGRGKATFEDGSHYQGEFKGNKRHGRGTIKYADGSVYQGDFKNNQIQGFGTLIGINHKYEGSWRAGKMDGAGKSSWFSEQDELLETYQGEYENGMKHGKGEYRWSNGRVYKGEWNNGEIIKPKTQKK